MWRTILFRIRKCPFLQPIIFNAKQRIIPIFRKLTKMLIFKTLKTFHLVNLEIYYSTPDLEEISSLELVDPSLDVTEPTPSWWENSEINLSSRSSTSSQELILISPSQVYLYLYTLLVVYLFVTIKRQIGWTDQAHFFFLGGGTSHDPRELLNNLKIFFTKRRCF